MARPAKPTPNRSPAPLSEAAIKKAAQRAAEASTRLENRDLPAGYVRDEGVKRLLAEREVRKH